MDERFLVSKQNRQKKMAKREAGSQVVYKPLGLAPWNRTKSRKRATRENAAVVKRARR